ncbi:MAG: tetratricopeptide repeat protein [Candidatus Omnitrophica bacterium]|nr:tetratricopeptide repeat protein [Candidatus Omnitrophota bacterium]MBU4478557.1 tetratricopeptide repeat protein [Candidatus Omnitrophota bacterium]MCG2703556.1 tetratricopeptide repeat protein [Candidatus Omnitrophota bacterium]
MKTLSRFAMGVLVFTLAIFSFGFIAGEVIMQQKIETIKQKIPNQWWYGGWDEEQDLQSILTDKQANKNQKAQAQYYIAGQHYANRDHQRALQEYRKLINDYPKAWLECQKAQFEIGQIELYRLNEPETAIYEYQKVIDNYQDSHLKALAQMMIARAYRRQQQYDNALLAYEKVIDAYPAYRMETTETHLDTGEMRIEQAFAKDIDEIVKKEHLTRALKSFRNAYQICPLDNVEFMERSLDGICRTFRCLDMNLTRANQFIKFQKYGRAGLDGVEGTEDDLSNPLEEIE